MEVIPAALPRSSSASPLGHVHSRRPVGQPGHNRSQPAALLAACAGFGWWKVQRRRATVRFADQRAVSVIVENSARQMLSGCDTAWMDSLLQQRAAEILFTGVERTEPAPGGLIYLYFPSLEIGPYTTQVRMTCKISLGKQRAEVQVLELNPGLVDKSTGEIEYQKDLDKLLEAKAEILLRWQEDPRSSGVQIIQQALQRFKYYLPGWFPVPDPVTEAVLRTFISGAIKGGQDDVYRALQKEVAAKS
mmetsp:Transcript_57064/g.127207  ORF Transcript_57064/g.127207 Transcript_57064/m.127207 type:complete len:247 (+) Transcript_57064:44-784(+)